MARPRYFLDDSESEMDDSMMSCSNISVSFCMSSSRRGGANTKNANFKLNWNDGMSSSGRNHSRRGNNSSSNSNSNSNFKFAWNDSSSSVCTEDLDESEQSFFQLGNYKRSKQSATPVGKILEQVDGVRYKESPKKGGLLSGLGAGDGTDSEEDDDALLFKEKDSSAAFTAETSESSSSTEEDEEEDERVFRDFTNDWHQAVDLVLKQERRIQRGATKGVRFQETLVTDMLEFVQEEDAALAVRDDKHVAEPHDQIPWDELDYEELPWHLQPDLDEDDELTAKCRNIIQPSDSPAEEEDSDDEDEDDYDVELERRLARVEGLVLQFVLKLKYNHLQVVSSSSN
ncbi:expressed unknown protein [Seminavis robusta]|uniref:Uncharacterized protein n=1 Tax=Seminavis robusta TaxID=568900 RepID=A0A9N8EPE6_9STRA|nr:expressed unknown protein [Seminavis robusta]|eukprot:Sro1369_g266900.1 n/a (343) ;mRNA; f:9607-10635